MRGDSGETLWQELVTSKGKSFQFSGVVRLRRSIELAGQENIRLGIERLASLDLAALPAPRPPDRDDH